MVPPGVTPEAVTQPGIPWGTVAALTGAIVVVAVLGVSLRRSHGTATALREVGARTALPPPAPVPLSRAKTELAAARRRVRQAA